MPKLNGGGVGSVGVKPQALTLSCLGPAATQLQSQQAAGLKDRLVLHQWVTHWDMCVEKTFARDRRPARHLVFLPEGPCSLLPRSSPRRVLPPLHSCEPFPYPIGSVGREERGMADIPVSPPLLLVARRSGSWIQNKTERSSGLALATVAPTQRPCQLKQVVLMDSTMPISCDIEAPPTAAWAVHARTLPFLPQGRRKGPKGIPSDLRLVAPLWLGKVSPPQPGLRLGEGVRGDMKGVWEPLTSAPN